mgnify:CR=1 FL=1
MKKLNLNYTIILLLVLWNLNQTLAQEMKSTDGNDWISLFNGKDLDGWKAGVNASTFSVEDGTIKVAGERSHLFYVGDVENHNFKNFEFKARVMTKPGSNSGIYIHTQYQEDGWPLHGYEVQVNNSQGDWKRTGSLYNIVDVKENYAKDNEWYKEYVKVQGNRIIVKINDIVFVDYTEPEKTFREVDCIYRVIGTGTFALQGHDPGSFVFYKDIMVRPLP